MGGVLSVHFYISADQSQGALDYRVHRIKRSTESRTLEFLTVCLSYGLYVVVWGDTQRLGHKDVFPLFCILFFYGKVLSVSEDPTSFDNRVFHKA